MVGVSLWHTNGILGVACEMTLVLHAISGCVIGGACVVGGVTGYRGSGGTHHHPGTRVGVCAVQPPVLV